MKRTTMFTGLLMLLLTPVLALGQSPAELGLVLIGHDVDATIRNQYSGIVYSCNLRLEFRNDGSEPIILIDPTSLRGSGRRASGLTKIRRVFRKYDLETKDFVDQVFDDTRDIEMINVPLAKSGKAKTEILEGEALPEKIFRILKPGEAISVQDSFSIPVTITDTACLDKFTRSDSKQLIVIPASQCMQLPDHLLLTYEFSFLPYLSNVNLLEKLRLEWRSHGRLPDDTNGTYTITSEPIK